MLLGSCSGTRRCKQPLVPDEIYFIETDLEQGPWLVWPMKYEDKFRPVEDWTGWTHTEFRVDTLIDLTTEGA